MYLSFPGEAMYLMYESICNDISFVRMWVLYLYIHMSFCVCVYVCVCVCVCMCVCVCECVCVCAGERERQYMRKTMAQRRKNASFSASSATKRGLTNIARPSSTKTARPHKEPL